MKDIIVDPERVEQLAQMNLLREISKDIIDIKFDPELIKQLARIYYEIARKHGIKWGTKTKGQAGSTGANPEWTITADFFLEAVRMEIQWEMLLDRPEDLEHYEEEE